MDIRAINAFQQILDNPQARPQDLVQVILNSNLVNLLATQQQAQQDEDTRRWEAGYGLQQEQMGLNRNADTRAQTSMEANIRMMEERIAQMREQLSLQQKQYEQNVNESKFNRGMNLLNTGLQYPNTGFATPEASQHISSLLGYPLASTYGQGIPANTWTGGGSLSLMNYPTGGAAGTSYYNSTGIPAANVSVTKKKTSTPSPSAASGIPLGGYSGTSGGFMPANYAYGYLM